MDVKYTLSDAARAHVGNHFSSHAPGSYFNTAQFPNPEAILAYIRDVASTGKLIQPNGTEVHFYDLPVTVGYNGVEKITDIQPHSIKFMERNGLKTPYAEVDDVLPETTQLCIVVVPKDGFCDILTMFPGEYAPPMPHARQPESFYMVCEQFWKNHMLVKSCKK